MAESIEEKVRPIIYKSDDFLVSEAVTADFASDPIDVREFTSGAISVEWSSYTGQNGAFNIQSSTFNSTDDDDWNDWGGSEGALTSVDTATGFQVWRLNKIGEPYLRLMFYVGNGATATLDARYVLKNG